VTKPVIATALFRIRQHCVGFGRFLKPLFRMRIIRVLIGMVLVSKFPVSAFQILFGHRATDTQYFVIIAFSNSHNKCVWKTSGQQMCRLTGKPLTAR